MPATTPASATPRPATGSALLVVIVLVIVSATLVVGLSFSTDNTPASIRGTTATSSDLVDGP